MAKFETRCLLVAALAVVPTWGCGEDATVTARDVNAEVERIVEVQELWPGFEPLKIPLAVYDGARTYLFRHPDPPSDFFESKGLFVLDGRHAAVVANSSAEIKGVMTATLLLDPDRFPDPTELAAVALHEMFHVYQRVQHPSWQANEVDLFTFPVDRVELLALRRLETEALRRASEASKLGEVACWAHLALSARRDRFAGMNEAYAAYERANELNEGLASYIQYRANETRPALPAGGFAADDVRARAYEIGPTLALLLDRLGRRWRVELEGDDARTLEALLVDAAGEAHHDECAWTNDDRRRAEEGAEDAVRALAERRRQRRADFDATPGWTLVIEASSGAPLWSSRFDPLNVETVDGGVLHTRYLALGNDSGTMEILDQPALTEAVGEHPLFNGVLRVHVTGFATEPAVTKSDGAVAIETETVTGSFDNAVVERADQRILVRLRR